MNKHLSKLSKRGPHRVLVGDLDYAGLPGKVYTPAEGTGLPAVAFGHDWMQGVSNYHATLRHLASWGIVVGAPDTEKGVAPNFRGLAADLETTLQVLAGVRLGAGNISVSPRRMGLVGHGVGASAALIAAVGRPNLAAVAALYPAQATPSPVTAASAIHIPGLIIGSEESPFLRFGNAAKIAQEWAGSVVYHEVKGAEHLSISDNTLLRLATGLGGISAAPRETLLGLLTGYLLHQLGGERKYSAFSSPTAATKKIVAFTDEELAERAAGSAASPRSFLRL